MARVSPASPGGSPGADGHPTCRDNPIAQPGGFYVDKGGNNHSYEYDIAGHRFSRVLDPADPGTSLTAAAINDRGDVAGFYAGAGGKSDAFLKTAGGPFTTLAYPGASATNAFGVNSSGLVVGAYTDGTGNSATTHGFTWQAGRGFASVDDPQGPGATTINGVNDHGDLAGFYANGNTDGFLATPHR